MPGQFFHADLTDLFSDFGENGGDHGFEGLFLVAAGFVFELALFSEGNEVLTFGVGTFDFAVFFGGEFGSWNDIVNS